ncbi:hypothetical protein PN465_10905 [Nodularia spumigena CS-584]|jgi:hypothetical protein|uniref:Uncharacterized protein n=1 Tax=Nodularia spumigena UHCC 0060 TaxID=3110300 RepID=A0ABU5UWL4_NODSP|nr:hypothetical protein [Nodularia spumigena]AHJ28572.1 hypothetical protein NSP_22400 [Nodularia spumigena CCY9414]EAW44656.1 hypothetical protein N9414_06304 [Nodularia spumigena CCY9414]MDB9382726.1 hypothetical protein [Nodularia spumigena CS-584]MEA5527860.1 hypothetical protein [Nodularia spumigena UHCC 0143]MEA5610492.1 hypothetical protein [Nodularia spumigena UHCC 0060]
MITKDQLFKHFTQYTQEQILDALQKLSKYDTKIKPDADKFSDTVIEQLEQVFELGNQSKNQLAAQATFTKEEIFGHFNSAGYSPEQITTALKKLSESDKQIDHNANEFGEGILEKLENTFAILQAAINAYGGALDVAKVEELATSMANEQAIDIHPEVFRGVLEIKSAEAVAKAVITHELTQDIYQQTLRDLDAKTLDQANQQAAERIALMSLLNNPETVKEILATYGINNQAAQPQIMETTTACSLDFDPDAFLQEVGAKEKKPKTIQDTRRVAQNLLSKYRLNSSGLKTTNS